MRWEWVKHSVVNVRKRSEVGVGKAPCGVSITRSREVGVGKVACGVSVTRREMGVGKVAFGVSVTRREVGKVAFGVSNKSPSKLLGGSG